MDGFRNELQHFVRHQVIGNISELVNALKLRENPAVEAVLRSEQLTPENLVKAFRTIWAVKDMGEIQSFMETYQSMMFCLLKEECFIK